MKNSYVAAQLSMIADLLDIKGEGFFKVRAYRQAAQIIEDLDENIETITTEQRLKDLPHVGDAIAKKIKQLLTEGKIDFLEELKSEIPPTLLEFLKIPSLGPKKVGTIYRELHISTIAELKKAAQQGLLKDLEGFGEISEKSVLRGISFKEKIGDRVLLNVATSDADLLIKYLSNYEHTQQISTAGSLRRMKETIGDLDILIASNEPESVMEHFKKYDAVDSVLLSGPTKTSVRLLDDIQVDLRVVSKESYGAALQYFTGSKEHNVALRSLAVKKGWKLNEYGLYDKDNTILASEKEEDIYHSLGLSYIPAELRENRGEIEASQHNTLPQLIKASDIKGDLHVHSTWSDGSESAEAMARAAKQLGYSYVAITDHSQSLTPANGLSPKRIEKKQQEIKKIDSKLGDDFTVLCGTECDILKDGSMDYADHLLKSFDVVYAAIHTHFNMTGEEATKRICKALENPHVDILAHPTCRLIGTRKGFDLDIETLLDCAKDHNTILEINSFPDRLDLSDIHVKMGRERHLRFAIGSDSHNSSYLSYMKFGVAVARRGWLEKTDVLNTQPIDTLLHTLGRER